MTQVEQETSRRQGAEQGKKTTEASRKPFKKSVGRENFESLVVAIILALFIRTFVVQAFKIPSGSMENNLLIGDHLLVNKLVYSPSAGPWEDLLLAKKPIKRGHVIIFKFPQDTSKDFIKRVVGLPGETIEIKDKKVYVNGTPLEEPYAYFSQAPLSHDDPEYAESGQRAGENWGPKTVPTGELFVMGDNRDNSYDSRFWGFLPEDQVKGRALVVYWSYAASRTEINETGLEWVWHTLTALFRTRWTRFFHLIQ
jgi:signal peptidase I